MLYILSVCQLRGVLCLSPAVDGRDLSAAEPPAPPAVLASPPQGKVNPYSVIDITPLQPQLLEQNHSSPPASPSSPTQPGDGHEGEEPDGRRGPSGGPSGVTTGITSGYSVPVPCGYATPSGVPLITPAYTTPVIIRHLSVEEDGKAEPAALKTKNKNEMKEIKNEK